MTNEPAPSTLGKHGSELWKAVVGKYDLRPDELRTLEDACAATDTLSVLEKEWRDQGQPFITKGSMGQDVEHPLIGSIDKQRKSRQAFFRQLKLPDEAAGGVKANQQRGAAQSRWAQAHGSAG